MDFGSRADRVSRGIEFMNKRMEWDPAVELNFERFHMHLTCDCIVGQHADSQARRGWINELLIMRDKDDTKFAELTIDDWAVAHGFDIDAATVMSVEEESYADLEDEWLAQLGQFA